MSKIKAPLSLRSLRRGVATTGAAPRRARRRQSSAPRRCWRRASASRRRRTPRSRCRPCASTRRRKSRSRSSMRRRPRITPPSRAGRLMRPRAASGPREAAPGVQSAQAGAGGGGGAAPADANPYADPSAPYKADRLSSNKFTQPVLNTPRSITVLTKEILGRQECDLAERDRPQHGGRDARHGRGRQRLRRSLLHPRLRRPQRHLHRRCPRSGRQPAREFLHGAGRDPARAGLQLRRSRHRRRRDQHRHQAGQGRRLLRSDVPRRADRQFQARDGRPQHAISPILAVRLNGLYQDSKVAGRNCVTDDRYGFSGSVVFKPIEDLTLTASYTHVYQDGLPDFGVPYNRTANRPYSEGFTPRYNWYGLVNRDFQKYQQDFGTFTAQYRVDENLTFSSRLRQSRSIIDYVGTLTQSRRFCRRNRPHRRAEPLSSDQYAVEPDRCECEIRHRPGQARGGGRRRVRPRRTDANQLCGPVVGAERRSAPSAASSIAICSRPAMICRSPSRPPAIRM